MDTLYDTDFVAWAYAQAELLRAGDLAVIDAFNIAEEIEGVARNEKREVRSRVEVLLAHLLKWTFQPDHRGQSWELTIREQRERIEDVLEDSPSLRRLFDNERQMQRAWRAAVASATRETNLVFPETSLWPIDQVLDPDFFPD
jgi:hypothetical protein